MATQTENQNLRGNYIRWYLFFPYVRFVLAWASWNLYDKDDSCPNNCMGFRKNKRIQEA
jgi:hypothetical protein